MWPWEAADGHVTRSLARPSPSSSAAFMSPPPSSSSAPPCKLVQQPPEAPEDELPPSAPDEHVDLTPVATPRSIPSEKSTVKPAPYTGRSDGAAVGMKQVGEAEGGPYNTQTCA